MTYDTTETGLTPERTDAEIKTIKEAQRFLHEHLQAQSSTCKMTALDHSRADNIAMKPQLDVERDGDDPVLRLPPDVLMMMATILGTLAKGQPVSVIPKAMELTTNQAALLLNVSRPYLITQLLEKGKIPYHKTGAHRRIFHVDIMNYKAKQQDIALQAMDELAELAQEMDEDY